VRGKKGPTGGTVIYACVCYDCLMGGVMTPMFWDVQSVPTPGAVNPTPKGI